MSINVRLTLARKAEGQSGRLMRSLTCQAGRGKRHRPRDVAIGLFGDDALDFARFGIGRLVLGVVYNRLI
jgi:hypothetical protein